MSAPPALNFNNILGPFIIGSILDIFLCGVTVVQAQNYFINLLGMVAVNVIENNLLTAVVALVDAILFVVSKSAWHVLFNQFLAKLYLFSLLTSLNSRRKFSETVAKRRASAAQSRTSQKPTTTMNGGGGGIFVQGIRRMVTHQSEHISGHTVGTLHSSRGSNVHPIEVSLTTEVETSESFVEDELLPTRSRSLQRPSRTAPPPIPLRRFSDHHRQPHSTAFLNLAGSIMPAPTRYEIALVVAAAAGWYVEHVLEGSEPEPYCTSRLSGKARTAELMSGSPRTFWDTLKMNKTSFQALLKVLEERGGLEDGRFVETDEKLCMFLWLITKAASARDISYIFQHSPDTVSKVVHQVLQAIICPAVKDFYIILPDSSHPIPSKIYDNPKFHPYFKDCLGAMDGTHVNIHVPEGESIPYRNRKGFLSQNVLAVCSFDLRFQYVLPGWEGSAPDTTVYKDARAHGFRVPLGRHYLADGGYLHDKHTLIPYQKVRYHLKEQGKAQLRPETYKELYNLRHAMLRNVIERIFGILKKKFAILTHPLPYSVDFQAHLVTAICVIYNSIRINDPFDSDIVAAGSEEDGAEEELVAAQGEAQVLPVSAEEKSAMEAFRDKIAQEMWDEYEARRR
ncbi:nuclease HARBI1, partial [Phenoliferia sp. Uapishka_3]